MFSLENVETFSQEIRKSRFHAVAGPVASEQAAREFIAAHSDSGATHNCWAWRMGQNYRFNDDGEPGGTAGKPILQAIDGQSLDGVVVLVTRWFGGILLGSGGLMRAYGGTAASCLRAAAKVELVATVDVAIGCGFSDLALVKARLSARAGVHIAGETFGAEGAELVVTLPERELQETIRMVTDITSGRAAITPPD
ncbi:putative YigZ family protein [Pseudaminobacter salicylatoxidans]|uniref:Putative YigZ family protein n=1 Tax=Pseudaminobacter salicylatoxidans TaxID=93369 RepID=A0A316C3A8_PSESE|nr:YigZ family protein [Pseudaminobacter salicylatoxidans]PWJ83723.1 putative YigZ family protein [Pseudaminobacter salicylatoxidans]